MLSKEDRVEILKIVREYCKWHDQQITDLKRQIDSLNNDVPSKPSVIIPKNTWIKTSEQLPIEEKKYALYFRGINKWNEADWNNERKSFTKSYVLQPNPTYWMDIELPEE